ncbi:hypothetical protein [Devosia sp.]|uniref:DUF7670 domain-containing protein n=1 Tax=Devosia sp. TaxID=1871048 RepID=UPI0027332914|nr:hypothetical protein [Devosia sp.]MDP2782617.1 hypothetical protein [Devosia sp.]
MHRILTIAARAVAILGIGFISMFALDVFGMDAPPLQLALGLFMHLLPSVVLVAVLAIGWRWPLVGGALYLVVAALPMLLLSNPFWVNAMLAGPFALAGVLFTTAALTREAGGG